MLLAGLVTGQASAKSAHAVDEGNIQTVSVMVNVAKLLIHCPPSTAHSQVRHQHNDGDKHDGEDGARFNASCSTPASAGILAATQGLPIVLGLGRCVPKLVTSVRSLGVAPPRRPPRHSS